MFRLFFFLLINSLIAGCSTTRIRQTDADIESARQSLLSFFSLLHERQFDQAINYYGGDYDDLRYLNPDIPPSYRDTLLHQACTVNGYMCMNVKSILKEEQLDAETFRFTIEFQNDDGTVFILGPCCGATEEEMPPRSEFDYTVTFQEGQYQVMELPVFIP
jgi:hypothetical protein